MTLYEGMFLIDNDLVRADWARAKGVVTGVLEKHGAVLRTVRRWDERPLAYPIRGRRRATYFLAYYDLEGPAQTAVVRDLELDESVLRYLLLRTDAVPEGEAELAEAELAADFAPPTPPEDSAVEEEEPEVEEAPRRERGRRSDDESGSADASDDDRGSSGGDDASAKDEAQPAEATAAAGDADPKQAARAAEQKAVGAAEKQEGDA